MYLLLTLIERKRDIIIFYFIHKSTIQRERAMVTIKTFMTKSGITVHLSVEVGALLCYDFVNKMYGNQSISGKL